MFTTFYLATYKEQYKLPHKTRHKIAGESPYSLPTKVIYTKWCFNVEILCQSTCCTSVFTAASW